MEWPYRRFIKAFGAFQRRIVIDELRARRVAHIGALYANTNLDGQESPRAQIVSDVENAYEELIANTWNGTIPGVDEESVETGGEGTFHSDFMNAGRRAMAVQDVELPGEAVMSGQAA
jgi:basic membrane lipoprotein Med (substrate-binding protein (PBP1-ABC) superfamily)